MEVNNENVARRSFNRVLTDREAEVLGYVMKGWTNHQIARQMSITPHTVKAHIASVLRKTGTKNRLEAAMFCYQRGLVSPHLN